MRQESGRTPAVLIPAGLAIVASTYGLARYAYGLFVPQIQSDYGLSVEIMGLIASGSYAGYLAATVLGSLMSGIAGPRLPIVLGGLAATAGMSVIAFSQGPWMLALGVVMAGASPGLAYPPLSDAVMKVIAEPQRNRTYAVINSGTSVGVIIAGPAALFATGDWRMAWAVFAVFAGIATVWNAFLMPSEPYRHDFHPSAARRAQAPLNWRWFLGESSNRLFVAAAVFGVVTAVYWTFAVDLLVKAGGLSTGQATAFWVLIGGFGLLGGLAGDLVRCHGLRRTFRTALIVIAFAIGGLTLAPTESIAGYTSGAIFGASFILLTGLFGIWSINVFPDRPAVGFGATFFLISAGQLIGPAVAGLLAAKTSMAVAFQVAAVTCCLTTLLGPRRDLFSMSRDPAMHTEEA